MLARLAIPAGRDLYRACITSQPRRCLTRSRDLSSSSGGSGGGGGETAPRSLAERFRALRQSQAVIYDMHEEQQMLAATATAAAGSISEPRLTQQQGEVGEGQMEELVTRYGLARGATGVLDVEQVVALLRDEALTDICVLRSPPELAYVGWLVIGTGRSQRHLLAAALTLRRLFKLRLRGSKQRVPHIEGREGSSSGDSGEWLAIDLINVAVHFMLPDVRTRYDVESLWALGAEFDLKAIDAARIEQSASLMEEFVPLSAPEAGQVGV